MPYDQRWMGFGIVGALEAGGIALLAGIVAYAVLNAIGRRSGWSHGRTLGVAFVVAFLAAGGQDLWNLFYFDLIPPQSYIVLRNKLAAVHDPDAMGMRVAFDAIGALAGAFIGSAMFSGGLRRLAESMRGD